MPIITLVLEQSGLDSFLGGFGAKRGFFFVRREPIVERESSCPHCQASIRYQIEKRVIHVWWQR